MGEEEAGKVGVEALVARDELVGEGESGHEATLLKPEDGGERACGEHGQGEKRVGIEGRRTGEEDSLDGGERDETLSEC